MLEVEYCNRPYSVAQKLQYMYRKHTANGPDDTPQSFILDTNLTAQSSGKEEWKRRSGRPLETPESVVARLEGKRNLTVVERQELWLAKKNLKTRKAQTLIAEHNMQERAKSAPDLSQSRRSFSVLAQERKKAAPVRRGTTASSKRRSSTLARQRSVPSAATGPDAKRSLGNITNHRSETKPRKRVKRGPISDPFSQRMR